MQGPHVVLCTRALGGAKGTDGSGGSGAALLHTTLDARRRMGTLRSKEVS
jgi:hypothetical protein